MENSLRTQEKQLAIILNVDGLTYDEEIEELFVGEEVQVLSIDKELEIVLVSSKSGNVHGINPERIKLI